MLRAALISDKVLVGFVAVNAVVGRAVTESEDQENADVQDSSARLV